MNRILDFSPNMSLYDQITAQTERYLASPILNSENIEHQVNHLDLAKWKKLASTLDKACPHSCLLPIMKSCYVESKPWDIQIMNGDILLPGKLSPADNITKIMDVFIFQMACCSGFGIEVQANAKRAKRYLKYVANKKYEVAQFILGNFYAKGKLNKKLCNEIMIANVQIYDKKFSEMSFFMNHTKKQSIHIKPNIGLAVAYYTLAAELSYAEAQYQLGLIYSLNPFETNGFSSAILYLRQAYENRHEKATYRLGKLYEHGDGIATYPIQAFKHFEKSAQENCAHGQYHLGLCYQKGIGTSQNLPLAVTFFKKAADQNLTIAQYILGRCYLFGKGVAINKPLAYQYFMEANQKNYYNARFALTRHFASELLIHENPKNAVIENEAEDLFNLALQYYIGVSQKKNLRKTYRYALSAADLGLPKAQKFISDFYKKTKIKNKINLRLSYKYKHLFMENKSTHFSSTKKISSWIKQWRSSFNNVS